MSAPAWMQLVAYLALLLLAAWPLARAMEAVLQGRFALGRRIEAPLYRLAGVDPEREQGWLAYALGLLVFNGLGVLAVYALQRLQADAAAEPARAWARSAPDSAFNTAVSFVTNTNWQGYGGESTMSYLTQMLALDGAELPLRRHRHRRRRRAGARLRAPRRRRRSATSGST